ncbi:MAG: hypothetical protein KBD37_05785 [Burkholderiales bacterium]|nr:hypothetical protein [Burkholderiales bacterium]
MYDKALLNKSDAEFKRLTGVKKQTFQIMLSILQEQYALEHKAGGKPNRLSIEDRLLLTLEY